MTTPIPRSLKLLPVAIAMVVAPLAHGAAIVSQTAASTVGFSPSGSVTETPISDNSPQTSTAQSGVLTTTTQKDGAIVSQQDAVASGAQQTQIAWNPLAAPLAGHHEAGVRSVCSRRTPLLASMADLPGACCSRCRMASREPSLSK